MGRRLVDEGLEGDVGRLAGDIRQGANHHERAAIQVAGLGDGGSLHLGGKHGREATARALHGVRARHEGIARGDQAFMHAQMTEFLYALTCHAYQSGIGAVGRRHAGHLAVLVAEHHGIDVVVADFAGNHHVANVQLAAEATGGAGIDDHLGMVHVEQQGRADGRIDLADAGLKDDHLDTVQLAGMEGRSHVLAGLAVLQA